MGVVNEKLNRQLSASLCLQEYGVDELWGCLLSDFAKDAELLELVILMHP